MPPKEENHRAEARPKPSPSDRDRDSMERSPVARSLLPVASFPRPAAPAAANDYSVTIQKPNQ